MGDFERSGMGRQFGLARALVEILTLDTFAIATIAALIGYAVFEFLRGNFLS